MVARGEALAQPLVYEDVVKHGALEGRKILSPFQGFQKIETM
jgi:hypothetical protein